VRKANLAQVELKYVSIASDKSDIDFFWKGVAYRISFGNRGANAMFTSVFISILDEAYPDPLLLYWLSLFFGEDMREPYLINNNKFN
jgi:hypothetical protein